MTFRLPLQISRNFIIKKSLSPERFPNTQVFQVSNRSHISSENAPYKHYCTGRGAPSMDLLLKTTRSGAHSVNTKLQSRRGNTKLTGTYHTFPNVNYTSLLYAKAQFVSRRFYSEKNYCKKSDEKKENKCCDPCKDPKSSNKIVCTEKPKKLVCPNMKVAPCKPRFRPDCNDKKPIPECTKTEAPYGSYGECCDDGFLPDLSECESTVERDMQPKFLKTIPIILIKIDPPLIKQVDPALERKCLEAKGCSEEEVVTHEKPKPFKNPCRTFKLKGCKPRARQTCEESHESPPCTKIEAPYECFTDCCPQFPEVEFTECDQQDKNVQLQKELFFIGLKDNKADPCAASKSGGASGKKSGGKSGSGSPCGGSSGGNPCAMKAKEKKSKTNTCACDMKKDSKEKKDPCAKKEDPCKAKKADDPCAKERKDPCAASKKDTCAASKKEAKALPKPTCCKAAETDKPEEKKKCERVGRIQAGDKTICACPPPPPPKIAPNPCNPDACKKKEGSSKKEDPCKSLSAKKEDPCKSLSAKKEDPCKKKSTKKKDPCKKMSAKKASPCKKATKKKSSTSCTIPKPSKCKTIKSGTNSSVCERKKPKLDCKLAPKMSLWDRIVNYFKAKPNCPAPDDYKKKELIKQASKMGLKLCPECPPKSKCSPKSASKPPALKKPACKASAQAGKDPCKCPPESCGTRKFSTCSNAYSTIPSITKTDSPDCEQPIVNYSTQMRHNYYSKPLTDKYIGKMYQLRLGKIGIRNALVKDAEIPPHTVCYICKFVPKKKLLTQKQENLIDFQPMKKTEKNRPTF